MTRQEAEKIEAIADELALLRPDRNRIEDFFMQRSELVERLRQMARARANDG